MKLIKTEYVQHQVETFENEMMDDFDEYLESVDQLKEDIQDAPEIFKKIQSQNTQNIMSRQFVGTLQHLLLLRYPPDVRYRASSLCFFFFFIPVVNSVPLPKTRRKQYFTLISTIVEQMLFDGKGIDPDFRGRYRVNVEKILASFIDQNKFRIASEELADAKAKAEAAYQENVKLDSQWNDNFDTTKAKMEAEINALRATIPGGGFDLASLSDDDAKLVFGKIGEDNSLLKKAVSVPFSLSFYSSFS